ncbi:CoA pyrophosphatase [Phototrophicus methaneseepsis]|uniref:CoA pyrophosphatase n=1 Tax=Phototrophicus methaneseepsis TaxID=2710758 RepID=A0A7S8IEW7_9CHLR|nr:CoA pyrophosphatase [Phototrophicus methaneseepsis]QPC82273.1 CoA pyrophosphatase [Phototrophicus methaneseepsis]
MITRQHLQEAVHLPEFDRSESLRRMAPPGARLPAEGIVPREAAVLVLIFPYENALHLVLTRRHPQLRGHSGQIAFPGGRRDPEDLTYEATALREACEEIGVCNEMPIEMIGRLSTTYIPPSNFSVVPVVAYTASAPQFVPNPGEVDEIFAVPLASLLNPAVKQVEDWDFKGERMRIPFYILNGHKVWGATAIMLSELEHRLRRVLSPRILAALRESYKLKS